MLDADLAGLYSLETLTLNPAMSYRSQPGA